MDTNLEKYSDSVNYGNLDPVKKQCIETFAPTFQHPDRLRIKVMPAGESGAVFDFLDYDFMIGFNVEGLGTKNDISDKMYAEMKNQGYPRPERVYRFIGQDAALMSVLDLASLGADPFGYGDFFTAGDDKWFRDLERNRELINGYKDTADAALFAIPCGETPALPGIVYPETLVLEGASLGLIRPKERFPDYGNKIKEGDVIYGLPSDTIAANGISKARKIAAKLPGRYFTKLPGGRFLGDALLVPTPNHVRPIIEMFDEAGLHYVSPITGHGWSKIARARRPFRYVVENLPEVPEVLQFLIEEGSSKGFDVSDRENYFVWNMGTMVSLIAPASSERKMREITERRGTTLQVLGHVEKGEREVYLAQKNVTYAP